jgi:hypothetical protein
MALKDELRDRWGILLGATAAGATWAVLPTGWHVNLLLAPLVGVAVWGTKAVLAALEHGRAKPRLGAPRRLPVDARAEEGRWLARARRAASSFGELAASMDAGPLADRVGQMRGQVEETAATLERLAGQATAAGQALARIDDRFLAAEAARLAASRAAASGEVATELDRAIASVASQRQVHQRLAAARGNVLARLESGTLGLESLVARVVELSTLAATGSAPEAGGVQQLADELEGIRQGLAETEEVSRRALGAYQRSSAPDG